MRGVSLPIMDGSGLSIKAVSPLLRREAFPGIRNLPFKGPITAEVVSLFGLPGHLSRSSLPAEEECTVHVNGSQLYSGRLRVTEATEDWLEYQITDLQSDFFLKVGEKKLSDFDFPLININRSTTAIFIFQWDQANVGSVFTIEVNKTKFSVQVFAYYTVADIADLMRDEINSVYPGYANSNSSGELTIKQPSISDQFLVGWSPAFNSEWHLVSSVSYATCRRDDFISHIENVRINGANYNYCFPIMFNSGLYNNTNSLFSGFINMYSNGYISNSPESQKEWKYTNIPYFRAQYILDKIFGDANISPPSGIIYDLLKDLILDNTYTLDDIVEEYNDSDQAYHYVNVMSEDISVPNHLPDLTVEEFLISLEVLFNFLFVVDVEEGVSKIKILRDLPNKKPAGSIESILSGPFRTISRDSYPRYILAQPIEAKDAMLIEVGSEWLSYEFGNGQKEKIIKTHIAACYTSSVHVNSSRRIRCPISSLPGTSIALGIVSKSPSRAFWYRGMFPDNEGNNFPYASSDDLDNNLIHISGAISLLWSGTYGLVSTWWYSWLHILINYIIIECNIDIALATSHQLDMFSLYTGFQQHFILLEYSLNPTKSSRSKVRLMRL